MFNNILVSLDGSEVSQRVLIEAVDQAKVWNAKIQAILTVENVYSGTASMDQSLMQRNLEMSQILVKQGEEVLEDAKKYCADKGITITTHMKYGDAGSEIISLAEQEKIDLIVIGSHGKSGLDRVLLGSVSSFVVTNNKKTTMVVRG